MTFIDDDLTIILHQIIHCAFIYQTLDHGYIDQSRDFVFPTTNQSNFLFLQPQK